MYKHVLMPVDLCEESSWRKALPAAVDLLTRREAVILEAARGPGFDVEVLKRAMADSTEIH